MLFYVHIPPSPPESQRLGERTVGNLFVSTVGEQAPEKIPKKYTQKRLGQNLIQPRRALCIYLLPLLVASAKYGQTAQRKERQCRRFGGRGDQFGVSAHVA